MKRFGWIGSCCVLLSSCSMEAAPGGGQAEITGYVGVYRIDHHTQNLTSCGAEGPATGGGDPYFQLRQPDSTLFTMTESTCLDTTHCAEGSVLITLTYQNGAWSNEVWSTSGAAPCHAVHEQWKLTRSASGGARIEHRITAADLTDAARCQAETLQSSLASVPCTSFEVYEGTKTAPPNP